MCVLVTVVELAMGKSKETRRIRLHTDTGSLQAKCAIVACQ